VFDPQSDMVGHRTGSGLRELFNGMNGGKTLCRAQKIANYRSLTRNRGGQHCNEHRGVKAVYDIL